MSSMLNVPSRYDQSSPSPDEHPHVAHAGS